MKELEIVQHRQIPGMSMFLNRAQYRTPHTHSEWEWLLVLDNKLKITCGSEEKTLQPGQMVIFSPKEPHEFRSVGESCMFLCLQISPDMLPIHGQMSLVERYPHCILTEPQELAIRNRLLSIAGNYFRGEELYQMKCLGEGILLLHDVLKLLPVKILTPEEAANQERRNARLNRLMQFVDENYMEKIRLSDFAEREGCSLSYLSHFVRETTNQTFQQYVNTVRFNCACKLIASGCHRMLDVCMESGFSDYRYFVRTFRQHFGVTPEEYAKKVYVENRGTLHHSIHSMEQFFGNQESLEILTRFR